MQTLLQSIFNVIHYAVFNCQTRSFINKSVDSEIINSLQDKFLDSYYLTENKTLSWKYLKENLNWEIL